MKTLHRKLDSSYTREDVFTLLSESPVFRRCQNVFRLATGQYLCLRPAEEEGMDAGVDRSACVPIRCRKRTVAMLETDYGDENIEFWMTGMANQLSRYAEKHFD